MVIFFVLRVCDECGCISEQIAQIAMNAKPRAMKTLHANIVCIYLEFEESMGN
jgi:hypothetical protein